MVRDQVVRFACWLFGHELYIPVAHRDVLRCECGRREATNTLRYSVTPPQLGRVWRLRG
jgi:hypothetical protein